jgi:phosphoglycerate transport regulatory protein PgtC
MLLTKIFERARYVIAVLSCFIVFCYVSLLANQVHSAPVNQAEQLIILTSFPEPVSEKLASIFKQQHPNIRVRFLYKKTPAAITHLQLKMWPKPDLIMASAVDALDWLSRANLLQPYQVNDRLNYTPFGYSGYGFMWNKTYFQQQQLAEPLNWQQLLQPKYQGHIAMSSPMRSGTTHVIVEMILQEMGWREGWAYLQQLGGNLATVTARSAGVSQGIIRQRFGMGLVIDYFAFTKQFSNPDIGFNYSSPTNFLPMSIGIVKESEASINAKKFVSSLLSEQGQEVLLTPVVSRYPINQALLTQQPEHMLAKHRAEQKYTINYDHTLAVRRYHLVNALFEHLITYRLPFLQQAWAKIYVLQQLLAQSSLQLSDQLNEQPSSKLNLQLSERLTKVISELKSVPFSELQLTNTKLLNKFTKPTPGSALSIQQIVLQKNWQLWSNQLKDRTMRELLKIEAAIKSPQQHR